MKCEQVREKISSYMDDELVPDLSRRMEQHLSGCEACQAEFSAFQNIDKLLRGLPLHELSPQFSSDLLLHLRPSFASSEKLYSGNRFFASLLRFFESFLDLWETPKLSTMSPIEELADFPPYSMGSIYFKLLDQTR